MTDHITILTHSRSRLAKLWTADGSISGYDETKNYSVRTEQVADIHALSALLTSLESDSRSGVIRGKFKGEEAAALIDPTEHKPGLARKIKALYDDLPIHWVLIEVDKFTPVADPVRETTVAITEYITQELPEAFHDASYHWQLSSSAGHPTAEGKLKVHLWFWLASPATSEDLHRWAKSSGVAVDRSVFNSVQFHYTAAPLAEAGVSIPVLTRSGFVGGLFSDTVDMDFTRTEVVTTGGSVVPWGDDDLLGLSSTMEWSLEYGRQVLFDIDPGGKREDWVNDLAAFHHEFHGSQDALDIAVEWSSTATNYAGPDDVLGRWSSFGKYRGGNPMTGRWLLKRRADCLAEAKFHAKKEWIDKLTAATDEMVVTHKICPQIVADDRLDDFARASITKALSDTFKRLGTLIPMDLCRKLVAEKRVAKKQGDMPTWAKGWVYVTNDDQFYRVDSEEWLSLQGFNARFNRELPSDEDGAISKSAAWVALEDLEVESATKAVYLPWAAATFELFGVKCVNTYRPSSTPVAVSHLSATGSNAVSVVIKHLEVLAGGRPEVVSTMLDWLAHNVQQPGVKVRWAPLLKGVEGDGKTILGSLLAAVMGRVNVRNVSPKVLGTDFTGWAEGSAVVVLEEIKLTGHNRYDILNALKPNITNDSIEIHPKGKPSHDAINTTNYIAFTNYEDALPLTDTDRRWWIIFTPFASSGEMAAAVLDVAPNLGAYFDLLHDAINQHPAELRRWLLDYKVSSDFKPNGSAPMTYEKTLMIGMSSSDEEDTLRDVLEHCEGLKGVTPNLFSSRCLRSALMASDFDISLNTTTGNRLFNKVGFTKLPKKVKWDGEAHVVWVKGTRNLEPAQVRQILDGTLPVGNKGSDCDDLFGLGT